jgi:hypothetical protein
MLLNSTLMLNSTNALDARPRQLDRAGQKHAAANAVHPSPKPVLQAASGGAQLP